MHGDAGANGRAGVRTYFLLGMQKMILVYRFTYYSTCHASLVLFLYACLYCRFFFAKFPLFLLKLLTQFSHSKGYK